MPRKPRVVVVGTPHHVYLRGNNRRRLFSGDDDRWFWLGCLQRGLEASACALHQLTMMTNHIHMIVTPPAEKALAQLVHRACQRFTQYRNDKRKSSGKLFEERYRSKVITDEPHLMMTTLYNDANAYRAGLVDDPVGHDWSTGPLHAGARGRISLELWTPSAWYRRLGRNPASRAKAYRHMMLAYTHRDRAEILPEELDDVSPYRRRIERPDGSSAREPETQWVSKPL